MKKRVLILGVGAAQVDAILHGKKLGFEVFGISYRHEGPGLDYVDHFEKINIIDKDEVLNYARSISADLVYSVGSDIAMPTVGYVSEKLGTPFFVSEQTAELLQNKGQMRQFLKDKNLSPVPFRVADTAGNLSGWDVFPAIIKPVDSQGQRGVFKVCDTAKLREYFSKSLSFSRSEEVIVEQYIEAPEISINALVKNGSVVYSFITDRFVVEHLPGGIIKGHAIPSVIPDWGRDKAEALSRNIIERLNIRNGPVYFQLKYTSDDVFVIEVTARLDGCHLWRLIELKYGVDLLELSLRLLSNDVKLIFPEACDMRKCDLYLDFFLQKPGEPFREPDCREDKAVLYHQLYYKVGETIRPINGYLEKTGYQIKCRK